MGKLFLTTTHHALRIRSKAANASQWTEITPDILERPFVRYDGEAIGQPFEGMHRALLKALGSLSGCDVAISYDLEESRLGPSLKLPHRLWAEVFESGTENIVLAFSHDTRENNSPYSGIWDWLEDQLPEKRVTRNWEEKDWKELAQKWSDQKRWASLLARRVVVERKRCKDKLGELQATINRFENESLVLSRLL